MDNWMYLGVKPDCGCIVAGVLYMDGMREAAAVAVKEMLLDGLLVDRVPMEDYKAGKYQLRTCPHLEESNGS